METAAPATPTTGAAPTVIGLDTSLTGTGIASSAGWCSVVGYTNKKNPITGLPHEQRLNAMRAVRNDVIREIGHPDLAVLELPAPSRAGGGAHERAWLWWEIYQWLIANDIPVGLLSTNQRMLYATGKGNAAKSVVVDAVARRWPDWVTEGNDNAADAVVLMAAGRDWLGHPIAVMPQAHRAAVVKATWPGLGAVR
jgi:crossover junction endodeoxyribonuclease RuvC